MDTGWRDEVVAGERALLEPSVRRSADACGRWLATDFREFGASGVVYDRAEILELLALEAPAAPPEMVDVAVRRLAPGLVLLTYRSVRPDRRSLRSSIWRHDPQGWRIVFHQGTPLPARSSG